MDRFTVKVFAGSNDTRGDLASGYSQNLGISACLKFHTKSQRSHLTRYVLSDLSETCDSSSMNNVETKFS